MVVAGLLVFLTGVLEKTRYGAIHARGNREQEMVSLLALTSTALHGRLRAGAYLAGIAGPAP